MCRPMCRPTQDCNLAVLGVQWMGLVGFWLRKSLAAWAWWTMWRYAMPAHDMKGTPCTGLWVCVRVLFLYFGFSGGAVLQIYDHPSCQCSAGSRQRAGAAWRDGALALSDLRLLLNQPPSSNWVVVRLFVFFLCSPLSGRQFHRMGAEVGWKCMAVGSGRSPRLASSSCRVDGTLALVLLPK
jgi:hypothetical protein